MPGQVALFKKYTSEIEFCFPEYMDGKDAYTIKYIRGRAELHRLCFEEDFAYLYY